MNINLPMAGMAAMLSHDRRVAVPFYRDDRRVSCLQFEPAGPVARDYPADTFDRNFKKPLDRPLEEVSLKLIGACRTCYLPGSRVMTVLLEIFNMTQTEGTGDLTALSQAALTEAYNKLAVAAGKPEVKGFKDKATAVARIQALQGDIARPTAAQEKAAEVQEEKAGKRNGISAIVDAAEKASQPSAHAQKVAKQAAKDVAKAKTQKAAAKTAPAKKAAKTKEPKADAKPRGMGIGAYACEVLVKDPTKTNEQVLEAVKKKFPEAGTGVSSIAWYRNKLKNEGKLSG